MLATHLSPIICKSSLVKRSVREEHALDLWVLNAVHLYTSGDDVAGLVSKLASTH